MVAVTVVALLVAVIAGVQLLQRYDPLAVASEQGGPGVRSVAANDTTPDSTLLDAAHLQVPFGATRVSTVTFEVRNDGRLALDLLGVVPSVDGWVGALTLVGGQPVLTAMPTSAAAGWPVTLGPGQSVAVAVTFRTGNCAWNMTGSSNWLETLQLRTRTFGVERLAELPLDQPVVTTVDAAGCAG
jgi:hypothetical protein